ncbi:MAG: alanine racemase [Mucinivorans sp.]
MNYTLSQIADLTSGTLCGQDRLVEALSTDSRSTVTTNTMFVALRTAKGDGHLFLSEMFAHACSAFMVDKVDDNLLASGASFVLVDNTLQALQSLAAYHRSQFKGTVVAITGSNGKTIVKEWFAQLWDPAQGQLIKSPRSYNSQLGVALSLLMIEQDERVAVIEAGISQVGEMERLEKMIRPDVGVLTNIGDAHSENFTSREQLLEEKLKLFKNCSHVVRADLHIDQTIEKHNLWVVEQIYKELGISHLPIEKIEPLALRLEVQQGVGGSEIINDSYNSDLTSIATALDFQRRTTSKHERVLIISDIEQSAMQGEELYGRVGALVVAHKITRIVAIGEQVNAHKKCFGSIDVSSFASTADFLSSLFLFDFTNCSILLKGSRSFAFERISHALELRCHTTILEVDLSRLVDNFLAYRAMVAPQVKIMVMIKASAYGAGGVAVARRVVEAGASHIAVAFADEGVALRQAGITAPIVVLNSDPGSFAVMIEHNLEPEIYSLDSLMQYEAVVRQMGIAQANIHLKLDTGMHRLGFMESDLGELYKALENNHLLHVSSIFSHLSSADDPAEDDFTRSQIALFDKMSGAIISRLQLKNCLRSLANSAGIERFAEAHYDMVRLGIGLYRNISTLKTRIVQVKTVEAGQSVGYNRRSKCARRTCLAIIPVGYADGMDRRLSRGRGWVNIQGVKCPTIGNICMDTTIIDVTDLEHVAPGDEVIVFGVQGPTADELAVVMDTISYEILTSISPRIKRVYVVD